jgi:hypothetical protein
LSRDSVVNAEAKRLLEFAGAVADGYTPDGSTRTGAPAADELLAPNGNSALLPAVLPSAPSNDAFAALKMQVDAMGLLPRPPEVLDAAPVTVLETAYTGTPIALGAASVVGIGPITHTFVGGDPNNAFSMTADGALTLQAPLNYEIMPNPVSSLRCLASNAGGVTPYTRLVTVGDVAEVLYSPASTAWALFETEAPANTRDTSALVFNQLTDLTGNARHFTGSGATRPASAVYPGGIGGHEAAVMVGAGVQLVGNTALRGAVNAASYLGIEMVVHVINNTISRSLISWSLTADATGTRVRLLRLTDGRLQVSSRRREVDAVGSLFAGANVPDGQPVYIYAGLDFAGRVVTLQVNSTRTTATPSWVAGTTDATSAAACILGTDTINNYSTNHRYGVVAVYRAAPSTAQLDANYAALKAKYGTA